MLNNKTWLSTQIFKSKFILVCGKIDLLYCYINNQKVMLTQ